MYRHFDKSNSQLVAHCFFTHGEAKLNNYEKYYASQEEQDILDRIELEADY